MHSKLLAAGATMAGGGGLSALWVLAGTVLLAGTGAHALYFHIGETEKRCFIEEIPDETMVIGEGGGVSRVIPWQLGGRNQPGPRWRGR